MPGHKTGVFQWEVAAQAVAAATKDSGLGHSAGNTDREDGASGGPGRDNETRVSLHLFDSCVGPFWGDGGRVAHSAASIKPWSQ